jgi:hypothetical protein
VKLKVEVRMAFLPPSSPTFTIVSIHVRIESSAADIFSKCHIAKLLVHQGETN